MTGVQTCALPIYTKTYRNGTGYSDTYAADDKNVGWFADATAYNNLKNSMLKSVYENGGFYVDTKLELIQQQEQIELAKDQQIQTENIQ